MVMVVFITIIKETHWLYILLGHMKMYLDIFKIFLKMTMMFHPVFTMKQIENIEL